MNRGAFIGFLLGLAGACAVPAMAGNGERVELYCEPVAIPPPKCDPTSNGYNPPNDLRCNIA